MQPSRSPSRAVALATLFSEASQVSPLQLLAVGILRDSNCRVALVALEDHTMPQKQSVSMLRHMYIQCSRSMVCDRQTGTYNGAQGNGGRHGGSAVGRKAGMDGGREGGNDRQGRGNGRREGYLSHVPLPIPCSLWNICSAGIVEGTPTFYRNCKAKGGSWVAFARLLGGSWAALVRSCVALGSPDRSWGRPGAVLGRS